MNEVFLKKIKLLKEVQELLNKSSYKYYIGGKVLINIYNGRPINNDLRFDLFVCESNINKIDSLNSKNRILEKHYNKKGNLEYYKYIDKNSLYIDLYDKDNSKELGINIKIYLNAKNYNEYKEISIAKVKSFVAKNLDKYMLDNFGFGYKYLFLDEQVIPQSIILDANISYEEYFKKLKENNVKFSKKLFLKLKAKEEKAKKYSNLTSGFVNLVKRTDSRFRLLEIYEDKKNLIIKLYNDKNFNELGLALNDYLIQIKKFYDLGLAVCFDKEIFDITINYLKNDKQKELAEWLISNTPKKHLNNINFSFKNKGKTEKGQLRDLQNRFVDLMTKFDKVCKENNINYFFDSGTVLGAIRNEGFLPWDDDVDVSMTYDNFQKLIKVLNKNNINGTKFVCIENTPNHTLYTAKIYDLQSTKVYYSYSLLDSTYGFHLDILLLDEYVDNKILHKLHMYLFALYGQLLNPNENKFNVNISFFVGICKGLMKLFGRERFLRFLRKIVFNNKNKTSKFYQYRWQKPLKFKKSFFEKQLYVPFENINIPIPCKYEEYLEEQYGESWFVIPLQEDRMPSKRVFNLYVPYNLYQDDYMSFVDKKKTNKAYEKIAIKKMHRAKLVKSTNRIKTIYNFYKEEFTFNKTINLIHVKQLFEEKQYGKIIEYLDKYYCYQIKSKYLGKNLIYIKNKDFLYETIYTLIMSGKFYDARKLLKTKIVSEILQNEYASLNKLIDNVKQISKKNKDEKIKLYSKYSYCIPFLVEYYDTLNDIKEKEKEVLKFNNIFPNSGEIMFITGKYLLENNRIDEAKNILLKARDNTRNGLIIKEINKMLSKINL